VTKSPPGRGFPFPQASSLQAKLIALPLDRNNALKSLDISISALAAVLPSIATAQDIMLDEIVVTANRTETRRSHTSVSASVIAKADLGAAQEVGIADAVNRLAGVSVSQQAAIGSPPRSASGGRINAISPFSLTAFGSPTPAACRPSSISACCLPQVRTGSRCCVVRNPPCGVGLPWQG
jgi:hypothetical protein